MRGKNYNLELVRMISFLFVIVIHITNFYCRLSGRSHCGLYVFSAAGCGGESECALFLYDIRALLPGEGRTP